MILGQLLQTGRRFCECRSDDFIPKGEESIVVISYTIHDQFLASSYEIDAPDLESEIRAKLLEVEAIAYIMIQRIDHRQQSELPLPIGRAPMDRITLTAATEDSFLSESFYLEEALDAQAFRLIPTSLRHRNSDAHEANLLRFPRSKRSDYATGLFPSLAKFAG